MLQSELHSTLFIIELPSVVEGDEPDMSALFRNLKIYVFASDRLIVREASGTQNRIILGVKNKHRY